MRSVRRLVSYSLTLGLAAACSDGEDTGQTHPPATAGTVDIHATASLVACPSIASYTISPTRNLAALDVSLSVSVTSPNSDVPSILWTATSGSFRSTSEQDTLYRCGQERAPTVRVSVSSGQCQDSVSFTLDCS